jgi:two-component system sensor histidine kinase UhpB
MNSTFDEATGRKMSARRDMVLIAVIVAIAAFTCVHFNVSELLLSWTRPFERLQLDELPALLLVVAVCLIWFSSRRYFETQRQLLLRKTVEARLAEALAENKRLAQQYVDMQESERKALARDLHDELGQYLNAIKLDAVSIREASSDNTVVHTMTRAMIGNIDRVYGVVTGLIRQLRPVGFDDLGVTAALEHCVGEWRSRFPSATVEMSISGDFEALDETRGLALYRLVQEALTNIARHARATVVQIQIAGGRMAAGRQYLDVFIADNGSGADMHTPRRGLGLVGMRERVTALGGSIALASEPGFKIQAALPMAGPGA